MTTEHNELSYTDFEKDTALLVFDLYQDLLEDRKFEKMSSSELADYIIDWKVPARRGQTFLILICTYILTNKFVTPGIREWQLNKQGLGWEKLIHAFCDDHIGMMMSVLYAVGKCEDY